MAVVSSYSIAPAARSRYAVASGVALLATWFGAAVLLRAAVAGAAGAQSRPAGLGFAAVLGVAVLWCRPKSAMSWHAMGFAVATAGVVVLPVVIAATHTAFLPQPAGGFTGWAAVTAVVATAEEAFLRGALFDAVTAWRGTDAAIVVGAVGFAMLHVPLYGWHVVPLDLCVGLLLGVLRLVTGGWAAPAAAHVAADFAGWWLL